MLSLPVAKVVASILFTHLPLGTFYWSRLVFRMSESIRIIMLFFLWFLVTSVSAVCDTPTPWPKKISDFSDSEEAKLVSGDFSIRLVGSSEGGSGGRYYRLHLSKSGAKLSESVLQGFSFALLEPFGEFPQIECWSRAGGGIFTRVLYRYSKSGYRWFRADEYRTEARLNGAKDRFPEIVSNPRWNTESQKLYFVTTRFADN